LLILGALAGAYVAGYFWLGEYEESIAPSGDVEVITRGYQDKWGRDVYRPGAWIEETLRGVAVHMWWMNDPDPFD
jgi:hypothetical protein